MKIVGTCADVVGPALARLRSELSNLRHKTVSSRFVPVSSTPYATHVPVLLGIARLPRVRTILELGSGLCSTPLLADRTLFPRVTRFVSLEDDTAWGQRVAAQVQDADVELRMVASIPRDVRSVDIERFDMIFIDDSVTTKLRCSTIRAVLARAKAEAIVVIHDFENRAYRTCVPRGWRAESFAAALPFTGVLYRDDRLSGYIRQLSAVIAQNRTVNAADVQIWRSLFTRQAGMEGGRR